MRKRPGPSLATHPTTLTDLIDRAFSRFRHREVVHLSRLRNGLNVLELWHGVTYAFKDLSLSCTAQFLQYFLEKREKHVTVVVGVFLGHERGIPECCDCRVSTYRMLFIEPLRNCGTGSSRARFLTFSGAIDPFARLMEAMELSQSNV